MLPAVHDAKEMSSRYLPHFGARKRAETYFLALTPNGARHAGSQKLNKLGGRGS